LFTFLFLLIVLGLGALGIYSGLQSKTQGDMRLAQEHYNKGLAHIEEKNYNLAIAELEMAVRLNPNFQEAKLKLTEARSLATAKPTPPPSTQKELADQLYREARGLYDQRQWDEAIAKLEDLRSLDTTYQQQDVKSLLFWAYYNHGLVLVNDGRIEEAVRRFDQALELQPNNPDALGQRHLASLYTTGLSYWEANWAKAVENFAALYQIEPNYRDVRQRLHDARVNYGDFLVKGGAWCQARDQYGAALEVIVTQEVTNRRDTAARECSRGASGPPPQATPSPGSTPTAPGTFIGQFNGYEDVSHTQTSWAGVKGRVVNAAGVGLAGKVVKISAFDWSATATTDGEGRYGFGPLDKELTFTVTLVDLPAQPVQVPAKFGMLAKVDFVEKR